jgi:hypothetical protein
MPFMRGRLPRCRGSKSRPLGGFRALITSAQYILSISSNVVSDRPKEGLWVVTYSQKCAASFAPIQSI